MKIITCHTIALFILLCFFSGCKKNSGTPSPVNNNEMNATVLFTNGSTVTINARGTKAILGVSSPLGGSGYISGTNPSNAQVYISLFPKISTTGTFTTTQGYSCTYYVNAGSTSTPVYTTFGNSSGTLTILSVSDNYLEGSFNAVCRNGADSVTVTGTFKGNIIGK
jgi:hypothetical protein